MKRSSKFKAAQLLFLLLFLGNASFAQDILIDSCGINDHSILNEYEVVYFKTALTERGVDSTTELMNKRILFLSGNYGYYHYSKSEFFAKQGKSYYEEKENPYPQMQLIVNTDQEKLRVKNHDLIVVTWSKIPAEGRARKKFIVNAERFTNNEE